MYELPAGLDVSFFAGQQLIQVAVGQNEIVFHFHPDVVVTAVGQLAFGPGGSAGSSQAGPLLAQTACALLGRMVTVARIIDSTTLRLVFDDESFVDFVDDSTSFESFIMETSPGVIVV
jgi:hypothetical protein